MTRDTAGANYAGHPGAGRGYIVPIPATYQVIDGTGHLGRDRGHVLHWSA